jgi:hypothetical protein
VSIVRRVFTQAAAALCLLSGLALVSLGVVPSRLVSDSLGSQLKGGCYRYVLSPCGTFLNRQCGATLCYQQYYLWWCPSTAVQDSLITPNVNRCDGNNYATGFQTCYNTGTPVITCYNTSPCYPSSPCLADVDTGLRWCSNPADNAPITMTQRYQPVTSSPTFDCGPP